MEKKEIILAEAEFRTIIKSFGSVSCELLKHNGFFNDILEGNSISDSQKGYIKNLMKSTDLVQKIVINSVMALGASAGYVPETFETFFKAITAKFQFESDNEEMEMLSGLAAYFTHLLNDKEKSAKRKNKDFAIEVKPNGIKN